VCGKCPNFSFQGIFARYNIVMRDKAPKLALFLKRILAAVVDVKQAIQDQFKAISAANEHARQEQHPPPEIRAEIHFPEGIERANTENQGKTYTLTKFNVFIAAATFVVVTAYATIAYLQWQEMIGATDAARDAVHEARLNRQQSDRTFKATIEQFHLDQRAWLGFGEMQAPLEVGKPFLIHFSFQNSGKTPALNVQEKHEVRPINKGEILKFTYKDVTGEPSRTVVLPNAGFRADFPANLGQMTSPQVEDVKSGKTRIYLYGKATYDDVFGGHHWVTFCNELDSRGWHACAEYNETDDQKPN
jgi:hypothetical protein